MDKGAVFNGSAKVCCMITKIIAAQPKKRNGKIVPRRLYSWIKDAHMQCAPEGCDTV